MNGWGEKFELASLERKSLRQKVADFVTADSVVLDCGGGLRGDTELIRSKVRSFQTLDYAGAPTPPDILFDLCEGTVPVRLRGRFDTIFCFSILEHVLDPLRASQNLFSMLRPGGVIVGYVPFLFPYHSGRGLGRDEFPDLWRFSPDAIEVLFSEASRIRAFPVRGRVSAGLMIASFENGRNRFKELERGFPYLFRWLNQRKAQSSDLWQSSGYDFVVWR